MTIKANVSLHTPMSLLLGYEKLALHHALQTLRDPLDPADGTVSADGLDSYGTTFPLLLLNAAIVEGTLRSLISLLLIAARKRAIANAGASGRSAPNSAERLVEKFHLEVDGSGGWDNLKSQYHDYFGARLKDMTSSDNFEAIEALFVLRNVLAHGTPLVVPTPKLNDHEKDAYPYKWQTRLQRAAVLLEKTFGAGGVFQNSAIQSVPAFFWQESRVFLNTVTMRVTPLPNPVSDMMASINDYTFGDRQFTASVVSLGQT